MKLLVIKGIGANIDTALLEMHIKDPITHNSYPTEPAGIAIIDANKELNWEWPDEVVQVGEAEVGRHHIDAILDPNTDIESAIMELYEAANDNESNEDMLSA